MKVSLNGFYFYKNDVKLLDFFVTKNYNCFRDMAKNLFSDVIMLGIEKAEEEEGYVRLS